MGTPLTGNTIASSYLGLLKSTDSLAISTSPKTITDGGGNDLPIKLSTTQFLVSDGSASVPTIGFSNDVDTGFFYSTNKINATIGGTTKFELGSSSLKLSAYGSGSITGTVTQRLGVTSSGEVVEIPIGAGALDGSGTAGKLAKFTDSDTLGDSILSESSTVITNTGVFRTSTGNAGSPAYSFTSNTNTGMFVDGTNLKLGYAGVVALTIDANSDVLISSKLGVGIATTPSEKLEVSGNIHLSTASSTISAFGDLVLDFDNSKLNNRTFKITSDDGDSTLLTLLESGSLGLGTTSPNEKFEISSGNIRMTNGNQINFGNGDVYIQGTTASDNIQLGLTGSTKFTFAQLTGLRMHDYGSGNITGTVAQRLGVDSSGNVIEIPVGGGTVDGSGTANTVTMWTDSDTIGNAPITISSNDATFAGNVNIENASTPLLTIKDTTNNVNVLIGADDTNTFIRGSSGSVFLQTNGSNTAMTLDSAQRVGIGTTSPATKLNVVDSTALTAQFSGYSHASSSNNARPASGSIRLGDGTGSTGLLIDYTDQGQTVALIKNEYVASTTSELRFQSPFLSFYTGTSPSEKARIDSSGNFLVGSTTFNAGSFGGSAKGINVAGVQPLILLHETDTDKDGYIGISGSTMFIQTADAIPIRFGTSDAERMRIASNGNVGIGETSPNDTLHVQGDVKIVSGVQKTPLFEVSSFIGGHTGDVAYIHCATPSSTGYNLLHVQGDSDDTPIEALVVRGDGNVGIGTTAPTAKIQIENTSAGNATVGAFLVNSSTNTNTEVRLAFASHTNSDTATNRYSYISTINTSGSNGQDMIFATNATGAGGSEKMRITSGGVVSIGSASPSGSLSAGGLDVLDRIAVGSGSVGTPALHYRDDTDTGIFFGTGVVGLVTAGSERARIDSNGRLGVNQTSPSAQVDVENALTSIPTIRICNEVNGGDGHEFQRWQYVSGSTDFRLGLFQQVSSGLVKYRFDLVNNGTSYASNLVLDRGRIGINSAPKRTFDVVLNSTGSRRFFVSYDDSIVSVHSANDSENPETFRLIGDNIRFNTGTTGTGSEAMRITDSGNVGIGTSTVNSRFVVDSSDTDIALFQGSRDFGLKFGETSVDSGLSQFQLIGINASNSYNNLHLRSAVGTGIVIDTSNNVGIGTSSPASKLEVESTTNGEVARFVSSAGNSGSVTGSAFLGIDHFSGSTNPACLIGVTEESASSFRGDFEIKLKGTSATDSVPSQMFMIDSSNGHVGINNSSPASKLSIVDTGVDLNMDANGSGNFEILGGSSAYTFGIAMGSTGVALYHNSGSRALIFGTNETSRMTINGAGLVNIVNNLTVDGSVSKGSGAFKIDHPLESKKDTHNLVHSFVESPQADNIYRGKVKLVDGKAEINIDEVSNMTEGTFVALNRDIQCFTSNESDWDNVKGKVTDNILYIESQNASSSATISWLVIGERQDDKIYESDLTDNNGKIIVEPLKEEEESLEI